MRLLCVIFNKELERLFVEGNTLLLNNLRFETTGARA